MHEVEGYLLDIVYSLGSGTSFLERSWTLFHYGLALDERWQAVFLYDSSRCLYIGVFPNEREGCFPPDSLGTDV